MRVVVKLSISILIIYIMFLHVIHLLTLPYMKEYAL